MGEPDGISGRRVQDPTGHALRSTGTCHGRQQEEEGLSDFLCNWPFHHTGTRSGNTSAKWFSAAFQSCTGRVHR